MSRRPNNLRMTHRGPPPHDRPAKVALRFATLRTLLPLEELARIAPAMTEPATLAALPSLPPSTPFAQET